jgi:hypothetical protein
MGVCDIAADEADSLPGEQNGDGGSRQPPKPVENRPAHRPILALRTLAGWKGNPNGR